jgi:Protein of unknown function (DUF3108)
MDRLLHFYYTTNYMGLSHRRFQGRIGNRACAIALFAAALLLSRPAFAEPMLDPFPETMRYEIAWNNIPIGRVIVTAKQTPYGYRMTLDTKTTGLMKFFAPLKSITWAKGRIYDGAMMPQEYRSESSSDEGKGRSAHLFFDENGTLARQEVNPKDDPNWRPEVPLAEAQTAYDPVTAYFHLREEMFANVNRKVQDTYVRTYDGRRLAEFHFKAVNNGTKLRGEEIVPVINTVAFRKPINGYTPKELKKFEKGDPKVHVYFSADTRFIPLEFEIYHWSGTITASLE